MPEAMTTTKDILGILIQLLILIVPIAISWFIRTYVRSSATENTLAATTRLANAAIDYVENLDKRGELALPPEIKKGGYKLKLAAQWLESELQRAGIKIDDDQAQKWIAAEFQKRVGDVRPVSEIAGLTRAAVDMVQGLERTRLVELPPDVDRVAYLSGLAADWIVTQLSQKGLEASREEALTWVRAEFLQRLDGQAAQLPAGARLSRLAEQGVEFLERLKGGGQIAVQPGDAGEDIETDIVMAWLLTEAARQGLAVSSDQIAAAAAAALRQRQVAARALVPVNP